jgi:hypothetical protein
LKKARLAIILTIIIIVSFTCMYALGGDPESVSYGPASNSGDGIPDGSGFEHEEWPNNDNAKGPAPNSGDGVPDGSGF